MIVQLASKLYIENGFTATDNKQITSQLGISNGNLTFHYLQRAHILTEFVIELSDFKDYITAVNWQAVETARNSKPKNNDIRRNLHEK